MKKEYILAILFFGGLWGISEAVLGDALYSADVPYASVPLTIIGFAIMAVARIYFPRTGTATLVAACAMLYKFLNAPFFACHLLGILLTGACYDVFFSVLKIKNRLLSTGAAVYSSYALFALMITYIFRYELWVQAGYIGVLQHILISGSIAVLGCAILVPSGLHLGRRIKTNTLLTFNIKEKFVPGGVLIVTLGLWIFSIAAYVF